MIDDVNLKGVKSDYVNLLVMTDVINLEGSICKIKTLYK